MVADRSVPGGASSEVLAWAAVVREFGVPLKLLLTFRGPAGLSAGGFPPWAIADAARVDWIDACRRRPLT